MYFESSLFLRVFAFVDNQGCVHTVLSKGMEGRTWAFVLTTNDYGRSTPQKMLLAHFGAFTLILCHPNRDHDFDHHVS